MKHGYLTVAILSVCSFIMSRPEDLAKLKEANYILASSLEARNALEDKRRSYEIVDSSKYFSHEIVCYNKHHMDNGNKDMSIAKNIAIFTNRFIDLYGDSLVIAAIVNKYRFNISVYLDDTEYYVKNIQVIDITKAKLRPNIDEYSNLFANVVLSLLVDNDKNIKAFTSKDENIIVFSLPLLDCSNKDEAKSMLASFIAGNK